MKNLTRSKHAIVKTRAIFILSSFIISFLIFSGCATKGYLTQRQGETGGEIVIAVGEVLVDDKDLVGTKKRAIIDAQKRAVEMVVGVYISGSTIVERAITVRDKIIAKIDGHIDSYEILSEKREGELYKVRIKALVRITRINEDLVDSEFINTSTIGGNPQIGIWIDESLEGKMRPNSISSKVVTQHLHDRGFQVIASNSAYAGLTEEQYTPTGFSEIIDADILILGSANSYFFTDEILGRLVSYRALLQLKAIKISIGEVLLVMNKEGRGVGVTRDMAGLAALTNVAKNAGEELALRLAEELNNRYNIR